MLTAAILRLGRLLRALVVVALAIGVAGALAGLALAWRLSQGPLDLEWAARRIEAAANTQDAPTRLAIGAASIQWGGFADGADRGLDLRLADIRLLDRTDRPIAAVRQLDAVLSIPRLLLAELVPRAISAAGVEVALQRDASGAVTLDLGGLALAEPAPDDTPAPGLVDSLAELARPPLREGAPSRRAVRVIEQLRHAHLAHSTIRLHDQALGGTWRLDVAALDLARPAGGGVQGGSTATLSFGRAHANLALQAELAPAGATRLQIVLAPIAAATVQTAMAEGGVEEAKGAGMLDAAVQATAALVLSPALRPVSATFQARTGGGRMTIANAPIGFDSLAVEAEAAWDRPGWDRPTRLAVPRAKAVLHAPGGAWPTTLTLSAELRRPVDDEAGRVSGTVRANLDHVAFADIASLWPARLGGHVRPWVTDNITGGTARDGAITLGFDAAADFKDVRITAVDGRLVGEDAVIWWLRPVPPIERAQAILTIKTPESLDIAVASARQGAATLKDGLIRITGLDVKDQFLALTADAAGPVPDLLALLRHPRLRLLDRKPIPMRNPGGAFTGKLGITLPLNEDLDFDDVKISAQGRMTDLRLGGLVAGRDLDRGDVTIEATSESLKVAGTAAIAGIPAELSVDMDFRGGPPNQVVQRAQAAGRATARQLAAAGLDPGGLIDAGAGRFTARWTQRRDTSADLQVTADLRDAGLALAGWKKPPGQPAEGSARVLLRGDRMIGIDQLRAQGPGMAVEGRAEMVGTRPLQLVLDRIVLGPTQAQGQVRFPANPGEPIRATLTGPVLDLSTEFGKKPAASATPNPSPGQPWIADVRFDRVLLSGTRGIPNVTAQAQSDGTRLTTLRATSAGPERVEATIRAEGRGRRVTVRSADGGALLRAFDVVDTVLGGQLALDALYDDTRPGSPLAGTAELAGFHVRNAPVLGKLLQAVTIYGVIDALSGPGLAFSEATMPFRWDGSVLDIVDARAFSASLGLTGKGRIDTSRATIDMQGTIVPAYVLNSMLGRIPVLGRLFSAERGGGLVAVNYGLRGPVGDPAVSVNPLSALTPGFLRGLFRIFD